MKNQVQDHIENLADKFANDPLLSQWGNPNELKNFFIENMNDLINKQFLKEREFYLNNNAGDKANGFCPERSFQIGTMPINLNIPRSRTGFYPAILPKYQRYLPDDYQELLYQIILGATSFSSALRTMKGLGFGYSNEQLEVLLKELEDQANLFHSRPLDTDWLFIYMDAKIIDLADEKSTVKKAIHFIAIGITKEGYKEVLLNKIIWGNESIDAWRKSLIDLKNRGVTRVLMILTDDFSGLTSLIKGLFPQTDHQLCMVHVFRNAYKHLDKEEYSAFKQIFSEIYISSSYEVAFDRFTSLCMTLEKNHSAYSKYLRERAGNYLAFTQYPRDLWPYIRSTNLPEGMNNLIETIKRNAGGHFHSEREVKIKMKIVIDRLHAKKWKKPIAKFRANIHELTQMFNNRFEAEIGKIFF